MLLLKIYFLSYRLEKQTLDGNMQRSVINKKLSSARLPVSMQLLDVENPFSETEDDPLLVSLGDKDITLDEVQRRLNSCKLTKLIVSIIKRPNLSHSVTLHATNLAVALLNGGNHQVQVTHHHSNLSYMCA